MSWTLFFQILMLAWTALIVLIILGAVSVTIVESRRQSRALRAGKISPEVIKALESLANGKENDL